MIYVVTLGDKVYEVDVDVCDAAIVSEKDAPKTAVKSGQVLLVLEAMKMENEILAPRDGTVKQVLANTGAVVDSGAPLVVIG
mgnify:CR=1 FL=1